MVCFIWKLDTNVLYLELGQHSNIAERERERERERGITLHETMVAAWNRATTVNFCVTKDMANTKYSTGTF